MRLYAENRKYGFIDQSGKGGAVRLSRHALSRIHVDASILENEVDLTFEFNESEIRSVRRTDHPSDSVRVEELEDLIGKEWGVRIRDGIRVVRRIGWRM